MNKIYQLHALTLITSQLKSKFPLNCDVIIYIIYCPNSILEITYFLNYKQKQQLKTERKFNSWILCNTLTLGLANQYGTTLTKLKRH